MKSIISLILLFLLAPAVLSAQTIFAITLDVPASEFRLNVEADSTMYAGTYRFGDSESEADLILRVKNGIVTGELIYGKWSERAPVDWIMIRLPLRNGRIIGGMLIADGWSGVFVTYSGSDYADQKKGLVMFKSPRGRIDNEYGFKR